MKETLYSRNAVYETLRAERRQPFSLEIAEGVKEKGRLSDILQLAKERKIPVKRVPRGRLNRLKANHQGVALEASGYPYADLTDIFDLAKERGEPLFVLLLELDVQDDHIRIQLPDSLLDLVHGSHRPGHIAFSAIVQDGLNSHLEEGLLQRNQNLDHR